MGWGQHVIIEWGLVLDWWGSSSILWPQQSSCKSDTGYCRAGQTDSNNRLIQRHFAISTAKRPPTESIVQAKPLNILTKVCTNKRALRVDKAYAG